MKRALPKILLIFAILVILLNLAFLGYGIYLYVSLGSGTIISTGIGLPFTISIIAIDCISILTIVLFLLFKKK